MKRVIELQKSREYTCASLYISDDGLQALCVEGTHEYFKLPKNCGTIYLCISDRKPSHKQWYSATNKGATKMTSTGRFIWTFNDGHRGSDEDDSPWDTSIDRFLSGIQGKSHVLYGWIEY